MRNENLNKLIDEALAIEQEEAYKSGALGFMSRALIQATMPHSKVTGNEFKRKNGSFKLTMLADSEIGLPYGSMPRLLISWITTEAVKKREREIILGRTLSEFMPELDLIPSGGRWGSITRLKDQMKRLFSASISCTYDDGKRWGIKNVMPIEKADLWWHPKDPNQATVWESKLLLGESFFNEIMENPVPIDMRALKALKQSPMAIDIYCWLTYRMSYLTKISYIPWEVLEVQFGSNYKDSRQFKRRFIDQLKKVEIIYPEAKVKSNAENFILFPSNSHVKKRITNANYISKNIETNSKNTVATDRNNENLAKKYEEYLENSCMDIVDNLRDENDKHALRSEFEKYLLSNNLVELRSEIIAGSCSKNLKSALYQFVNKHWHHILEPLLSFEEFQ